MRVCFTNLSLYFEILFFSFTSNLTHHNFNFIESNQVNFFSISTGVCTLLCFSSKLVTLRYILHLGGSKKYIKQKYQKRMIFMHVCRNDNKMKIYLARSLEQNLISMGKKSKTLQKKPRNNKRI